MIELVARIRSGESTEARIDEDIELFLANCRHPDGAGLIFWPHGFPHDPTRPEPTAEEIVERAMSHPSVTLTLPESAA